MEFDGAADTDLKAFGGAFVLGDQLVLVIGVAKKPTGDPVELPLGTIAVVEAEHLDKMDQFVFADALSGLQTVIANTSADDHLAIEIVKRLEQQRRRKDHLKRTLPTAGNLRIADSRIVGGDCFASRPRHPAGEIKIDPLAASQPQQTTFKEVVVVEHAHPSQIGSRHPREVHTIERRRQSERRPQDFLLLGCDLLGRPASL